MIEAYTEREVLIERVLPNPYRDFDIHPIHKHRIAELAHSYDVGLGKDFGTIIPVRPHPTRPGFYQQACGHHRLAALKHLGRLKILCQIAPRDDEEMLSIMIRENANNYGNNTESLSDSICGLACVIAYNLYIAETYEQLNTQAHESVAELFTSSKAYDVARGQLIKRGRVGLTVLLDWLGGQESPIKEHEIQAALGNLNSTGRLAERLSTEKRKADRAIKARKAEEIRIEEEARKQAAALAEEEKAFAKAEKERKARLAKEEEDRKARKEKLDAQKEKARKAEKLKQEQESARRRAALAKERERIEKEQKEREARDAKRKADAAEAQEAFEKAREGRYINDRIIHLLPQQTHFDAFRKVVKAANARYLEDPKLEYPAELFPVNDQPNYVTDMVESIGRDNLTAASVRAHMEKTIEDHDGELKARHAAEVRAINEQIASEKAERERRNKFRRADGIMEEGQAAMGRLDSWWGKYIEAMRDEELAKYMTARGFGYAMDESLDGIIEKMKVIRELTGSFNLEFLREDIDGDSNIIDIN